MTSYSSKSLQSFLLCFFLYIKKKGDPLYVGMDITIASFDAISEVNMVSKINLINVC